MEEPINYYNKFNKQKNNMMKNFLIKILEKINIEEKYKYDIVDIFKILSTNDNIINDKMDFIIKNKKKLLLKKKSMIFKMTLFKKNMVYAGL